MYVKSKILFYLTFLIVGQIVSRHGVKDNYVKSERNIKLYKLSPGQYLSNIFSKPVQNHSIRTIQKVTSHLSKNIRNIRHLQMECHSNGHGSGWAKISV